MITWNILDLCRLPSPGINPRGDLIGVVHEEDAAVLHELHAPVVGEAVRGQAEVVGGGRGLAAAGTGQEPEEVGHGYAHGGGGGGGGGVGVRLNLKGEMF